MKAGTAQTLEAQTVALGATTGAVADWTEVKYTFTPEADGEYCFSIVYKETAGFRNCGNIAIDDVTITGYAPGEGGEVTPPAGGEPVAFEFFEDFDDNSHFANGGIVPDGWLSTGTCAPAREEAGMYLTGYDAHSGSYMLNSLDQMGSVRDEVLYTPMMKLAGGKEASISFYIYAPSAAPFYSYVDVKAGTAQTLESQTIALGATSQAFPEWTEVKYVFTPETDGEYCFSIAIKQATELSRDHGWVGIDDVTITGYAPGEGGEVTPPAAEPVAFEFFEDFDDNSHFANGGIVPDGWLSTGTCAPAREEAGMYLTGYDAHSGSYMLNSLDQMGSVRDEVLYTPMMKLAGGKEASISFYIYAPSAAPFYSYVDVKAGTAQTLESQTIALGATSQAFPEWTEVKYVFTPETDGEYCFSIAIKQATELSRDHGWVGIDDVTITGYAPGEGGEVTPPAAEPTEFEAFENFDDETHFSDGGSVPNGWLSNGTYDYARPYRCYSWDAGVMPHSGDYILFSQDQIGSDRDEVVFTPMMKLAGGKEATISFFIQAPGGTPVATFYSTVEVKAGTAQTLEAQTVALGATTGAMADWTEVKYAFTPEADGEYCFSIVYKETAGFRNCGNIAIDDVTITGWTPAESGDVDPIIPVELTITPAVAEPTLFVGETFATSVNVKAANLVGDITVQNISSEEVAIEVETIPMADAMSEAGYTLNINVTPAATTSTGATFELAAENLETATQVALTWKAIERPTVTLSTATMDLGKVYVGDENTAIINVKATNLVADIAVENISNEVLTTNVTTIPMADAMSEAGYDLVVTLKAVDTELATATFNLNTENLKEAVAYTLNWNAVNAVEIASAATTIEMGKVYVGDENTATINVKATNLVADIAVENISNEVLTTNVTTIPMADAMSEAGYDLVVTLKAVDTELATATFNLNTENLKEVVTYTLNWTAANVAEVVLTPATYELADAYVGGTYTTTVNVKATNLVADIAIENISSEVTTNVTAIPMAEAMSEAGYNLQVTIVPATTKATTASLEFTSENMKEAVSFAASWTAQERAVITVTPEVAELTEALLGREYEFVVNVKATNLVGDINVTNVTAGEYKNDVMIAENTIAMADAMSENGYDLVLTVTPSVMGRASIVIEFSTPNEEDATYFMLQWSATSGLELLEPNQDNYATALEAPYYNTFDNYDNDYDGTTVVPKGWATVGSYPFFTAAIADLEAVTGDYYLVADESELDQRDDRLYTPFFRLSPDYEYTISYYLYMPGNSFGGVLRATDMQVTVGTEQDFDFHPVTLHTVVDESLGEWVKQEFTFKPLVSGAYCFAFTLNTDVNYSGMVAIDDFNITAPGLLHRPTANFAFGGLYNVMDSKMMVFEGQMVTLTNLSKNAETYEWSVEYPNGVTYTSDLETPEFEFNESGDYSVTLTATNARASRSTTRSVSVEYVNYKSESLSVMTWNPNQDGLLERGLIPSFVQEGDEESAYDFVTGYNRLYTKFAERFELPEGTELNISMLNLWMAHYKNCAFTNGYDSEKQFDIVFYGETNGQLDENKVFARVTSTLKEVFGNTGIGSGAGEGRNVNFEELCGEAVPVEGTFYLAFEFADDMVIRAYDPNLGRSYFATNVVEHATGISTLYVKPTAVLDNSLITADGKWYPVDKLDNTKKGLGAYFILWANNKSGDIAINALGETVFAVRVEGDNLIVSGTQAGEQVLVYDVNGMLVAGAEGQENSTIIPVANLNDGVYIVNTIAGSGKFVK